MGNRPPLPPPPSVSPDRAVVWGISTNSKLCGLRLQVLGRDAYHDDDDDENGVPVPTSAEPSQEEPLSVHQEDTGKADEEGTEAQEGAISIGNTESISSDSLPQQLQPEVEEPPTPLPTDSTIQSTTNNNSNIQSDGSDSVIPQFLRTHTSLSASEWQRKMHFFENEILPSWKGGYARTLLLIWALLVIISFLCAYMIPNFWGSTLFSKPWFLLGFCSTQILLFTILLWYSRRETHRMVMQTRSLFRPWRRQHGVNVSFYQVTNILVARNNGGNNASIGIRSRQSTVRTRTTKQPYAGSYCFVLVCTMVREEDVEALELASLGTARDDEDDDASNEDS